MTKFQQDVALSVAVLLLPGFANAQTPGEGANPARAVNDPDQYAWELFTELNSDAGAGDGRVVWETWRSAASQTDIFLPDGAQPPNWPEGQMAPLRELSDLEPLPRQLEVARAEAGELTPAFDPDRPQGNEVRLNRAAFGFILAAELYNLEGQFAFFSKQNPSRPSGFPIEAKEIKAQWRRLEPGQNPADFHTATLFGDDGSNQTWGLTALHITTKDLPNWFWATFEHNQNPGIEDQVTSVDTAGLPVQLRGTKWENYVLRGTQIDFVSPVGRPTILANTQIEAPFQQTSSCITCHARASISLVGGKFRSLGVFQSISPLRGDVGLPSPDWFLDNNLPRRGRVFFQTDFVWSLGRAKSKASL